MPEDPKPTAYRRAERRVIWMISTLALIAGAIVPDCGILAGGAFLMGINFHD